jgi:hypothetical protein
MGTFGGKCARVTADEQIILIEVSWHFAMLCLEINRRHPELVSGSISPASSVRADKWMLKQVQHDGPKVHLLPHPATANGHRIAPMAIFALLKV